MPDPRACADIPSLTASERALLEMPADSWLTVPGTALDPWCRSRGLVEAGETDARRCGNVIRSWGGAAFDPNQRRLLFSGAAGRDYPGNEVYGFDIASAAWHVVRPPTPLAEVTPGFDTYLDGSPASLIRAGALVYLPDENQMMFWGGGSPKAWSMNPDGRWLTRAPFTGPPGGGLIYFASDYDEATQAVFTRFDAWIYRYSVAEDQWTEFAAPPSDPPPGRYRSMVIAPLRRLLFVVGGTTNFTAWNLETNSDVRSEWPNLDDDPVIQAEAPGLAYDPLADAVVAWSGGAPSILSMTTRAWTRGSSVGAPSAQFATGTFGRFRYIEYLNVFVLVNGPTEDVYFYKHTPRCGT